MSTLLVQLEMQWAAAESQLTPDELDNIMACLIRVKGRLKADPLCGVVVKRIAAVRYMY